MRIAQLRQFRQILSESIAVSRAQRVLSTVTIVTVAGMMIAVMLTTDRTVGAEQQVLAAIDDAGTRTIMIRADPDAGLSSDVLERLQHIGGIEWVGGFGMAVDATNALLPEARKVPVRYAYGEAFVQMGVAGSVIAEGELAWASRTALEVLGLPDSAGGITLTSGISHSVMGVLTVPDFLSELEPLVIVPQPQSSTNDALGMLIVVAQTPELVPAVSAAVLSVAAVDDPSRVQVHTSKTLASLHTLIAQQLGSFSRSLVLAIFGLSCGLLAAMQLSLVMIRRKDFGRRRALGATRGFIVTLIMLQSLLLAALGSVIGIACSLVLLFAFGDPIPHLEFVVAVVVLALAAAVLASVVPAMVASTREPVRELRVP